MDSPYAYKWGSDARSVQFPQKQITLAERASYRTQGKTPDDTSDVWYHAPYHLLAAGTPPPTPSRQSLHSRSTQLSIRQGDAPINMINNSFY